VSASVGSPDSLVVGLSPNAANNQWRNLMTDLGLNFHMHQIRHSVATKWLADGVPVVDVAATLGHADASITLKVYAHATTENRPVAVAW
jgi:integrase